MAGSPKKHERKLAEIKARGLAAAEVFQVFSTGAAVIKIALALALIWAVWGARKLPGDALDLPEGEADHNIW